MFSFRQAAIGLVYSRLFSRIPAKPSCNHELAITDQDPLFLCTDFGSICCLYSLPMPLCLPVCLSVYLPVCLPACLSVCLSVSVSLSLSLYLSVSVSASVSLSLGLSFSPLLIMLFIMFIHHTNNGMHVDICFIDLLMRHFSLLVALNAFHFWRVLSATRPINDSSRCHREPSRDHCPGPPSGQYRPRHREMKRSRCAVWRSDYARPSPGLLVCLLMGA